MRGFVKAETCVIFFENFKKRKQSYTATAFRFAGGKACDAEIFNYFRVEVRAVIIESKAGDISVRNL